MTEFDAASFEPDLSQGSQVVLGDCAACPMIENAEYWAGVHRRSNERIIEDLSSGAIEEVVRVSHNKLPIVNGSNETYDELMQDTLRTLGRQMERSDRAIESHERELRKMTALCSGVVRAYVIINEQDGEQAEYSFISCGSPSLIEIDGEIPTRATKASRRRII